MTSAPLLSLTAVVCTHNRATRLAELVNALRRQILKTEYEIILVDSASTDETPNVCAALSAQLGTPVRVVREDRAGHSHARNAGAKAARSEIVAYIDDDALPEPNWLAALDQAFKEHPDVAAVAGAVNLVWEGRSRPSWLPAELERYYSGTGHLGHVERDLENDEYPVGANLAIRRAALERVGGFRESFGRLGGSLLSNDDVDVSRRLRREVGTIRYVPSALVCHDVPHERQAVAWLVARLYWQGVSDARLAYSEESPGRVQLFRRSGRNALMAAIESCRAARWAATRTWPTALTHTCYGAAYVGRFGQELRATIQRQIE